VKSLWTVLHIAGVFVLGILILMIASTLAQILSVTLASGRAIPWLMPMLTHGFMLLLSLAAMAVFSRGRLGVFGVASFRIRPFALIAGLSLIVGLAANLLFAVLELEFDPVPGFTFLNTVIFVWLWASICEEALCRGLLQTLFAQSTERSFKIGPLKLSLANILAGLMFTLMHVPVVMMGASPTVLAVLLPAAFALGLIAGYVRENRGSLYPAIIVHMLFNISGSLVEWGLG